MAGTIDELNFKVILDDKEFDAKVKQDIQLATQLNTSLSSLLNIKKQVGKFNQDDVVNNRKAQQIAVDTARAQERINREHEKTIGLKNKLNAQVERINRGYQSQSRILNELKGIALGYLSIHGAGQLLSSLVRVTGEFELQKTTLAAMLGDLNKAEGIITRIQGLAVESPFQFKELTTYAKQLSAFSVPAQELYDTTKMLADISAGLGVGMDRIVLAYGQVRSAAFLRGQEVRQFTEAGIPILDELAKQFSELEGRAVSTGEVFDKISARLVPFEMVAKVFKDMTSEGGKFYNMQEVQAETLRGKISNLKDAYEVMLNEIGKGQSENLKGAVDWARRLMQNYEETGRTLVELVAAYGVYKAALLTLTIVTNNFALANSKLYTSLINATKWAIKNPYVILAAGITAAGYAIYKNITALEGYEKVHKSFVETEEKYNASLSAEGVKLDALYAKLRLAKEGTEEYEKAKKQIYTQYAGYISDLKEEGVEVGNLATLYDSLKIKIEEYTKAKFRSLAQSDLDQTFEQEVSAVRDRYKILVSEIESIRKNAGEEPLSAMDKEGLWQYITGDIATLWDMAENPDLKRIKGVLASKILPFGDIAKELQGDLRKIKSTYVSDMQAIINLYGETSDELAENDPFKVPLGGDGEGGKSPAQKAIEEQIKSVQKLQDAYEKLMPYLNEAQTKSTLKSLFPNIEAGVIDSLDFDAELTRLADKLEEFDKDAAQRLRDTISKDVAGTIAESFETVLSYKKMLDSWLGKDFDLTGEGVSFDISKIIRNLNNEYAKIDQKRLSALEMLAKAEAGDAEALKLVREKYGEEVWRDYLENGKETIEKLAKLEREMARKNAEENIRDTASKYVAEKLSESNINLSDFGDKNINQVRTVLNRLKDLVIQTKLEMATLYFGGVNEQEQMKLEGLAAVLDILQVKINDTSEELDKKLKDKIFDIVKGLGSSLKGIGDDMQNLGEDINSNVLKNLGKALSEYADFAQNLSSSIKDFADEVKDVDFENASFKDLSEGAKGGVVGIIASVITFAYNKITNIITSVSREQIALNNATAEYARILTDIRRDSYKGMWGTDDVALAAENVKILTEAQEEYQRALNSFQNDKQLFRRNKYYGTISLEKESIADILGQIANAQEWDLYRENGELNIDALIAYYDAYVGYLTDKQKGAVDAVIEAYNAQDAAAAQSAEYLTSLFSGVADTIAENMVDAFIESGDAAIDMGNIISDLSRQMVADLIKSVYLMPILNAYKEQFAAIDRDTSLTPTERTEQQLNLLDTALSEISSQSDAISATIDRFEDYLRTTDDQDGTTDLAQGIKGITEDQANLLASYLNAIRADVSYSKTLWVKMDANLQKIANLFTSSPTLMEYQAQIAANTYNTAIATQEILLRLNSVIGIGNDGDAIKVIS